MTKQEDRIFVVDDDETTREQLAEILLLKGYTVEGAGSAEKTIEKIKDWPVDLFLIDLRMPGMGGIELLKNLDIKNNLYEALIITAFAGLDSAKEAMEYGAFSYLSKPITYKDIAPQIKKALEMVKLKKLRVDHAKELEEKVEARTKELEKENKKLKLVEDILRKSEERYRNLFEMAPVGIGVATFDGKVFFMNRKMAEITGYSSDELEKINLSTAYENVKDRKKLLDLLNRDGVVNDFPVRLKRKDSTLYDALLSVSNVYIGARHLLQTICVDITERKKVEEALKESEQRYRALFEQAVDSITLIDAETGEIVEFNDRTYESLGYTRKELAKLKIPDFEAIESKEEVAKHMKKIIKNGSDIFETKHKTKNGEIRDILVSSKAIPLGGKLFFYGIWYDITERKETENSLRIAEESWRNSFNSLEDVMLIIDKDYNIGNINKNGLKLLGKKREEIIGEKCYKLICGESKPRKFCPFKLTLKTKKVSSIERYVNKFGKDFSINTSPIFNEKGEIIKFVDLMRDITESKKAEEELKNSQKQLRDLTAHLQSVREQERTSIAREIHDELGQVLTALKMDLSWLNKNLPEDQKKLSEKTESMNKLINSTIKTVKRISTELRPGLLDDLGLTAAIEWQANEFSNRTGIKCKVSADFEEDILNDDSKVIIFRIFQETLTNVCRHAEATKVKVNLREKKRELVLKVSDNGKGIEEEHISDLESFGLIGIKERARFIGGEVMIEGIEGKGTTVIVSIPVNKETVRSRQ